MDNVHRSKILNLEFLLASKLKIIIIYDSFTDIPERKSANRILIEKIRQSYYGKKNGNFWEMFDNFLWGMMRSHYYYCIRKPWLQTFSFPLSPHYLRVLQGIKEMLPSLVILEHAGGIRSNSICS